jgi:hypothetical protein
VVTIPQGALEPGTYDVTVTNPQPAGCSTTLEQSLEVVPPPILESVEPATVCSTGGSFQALGQNFREGANVLVGDEAAFSVDFVDQGALDVLMGQGLSPGVYDVTVINAEGCEDTLENAITVVPGPILFWVDPPVAYSPIATQITLYVAGITGNIGTPTGSSPSFQRACPTAPTRCSWRRTRPASPSWRTRSPWSRI